MRKILITAGIFLSAFYATGHDNEYGHFERSHNYVDPVFHWISNTGNIYNYTFPDYQHTQIDTDSIVSIYNIPHDFKISMPQDTIFIYRIYGKEIGFRIPFIKNDETYQTYYWSESDSISNTIQYERIGRREYIVKRNITNSKPLVKTCLRAYFMHLVKTWDIDEMHEMINLMVNCTMAVDGSYSEITRIIINNNISDVESLCFDDNIMSHKLDMGDLSMDSLIDALKKAQYINSENDDIINFIKALPPIKR